MASYFSVNSDRKVTKRTPPRPVCPSGSRGIQLCLRVVLTRRPGSTGLDSTSVSAIFFIFLALPKPNASANFTGRIYLPSSSPKPVLSQPKRTASLVGSIDQGRSIESCRARMASQDDPLAVKLAEGMRSTSARDAFFGLRFFCVKKR